MPEDEQGVKWACQPCIRGHRSSKCQHWDRFMLKVRKPGRPLTSCPHTSTKCTCFKSAVMMMRVTKDSKCFCAPDPDQEKRLHERLEEETSHDTPESPMNQFGSIDTTKSQVIKRPSETSDQDLNGEFRNRKAARVVDASIEAAKNPQSASLNPLVVSTAHQGFGSCCSSKAEMTEASQTHHSSIAKQSSSGCCEPKKPTPNHQDSINPVIPTATKESELFGIGLYESTPALKRRRSSGSSLQTAEIGHGCCAQKTHSHQNLINLRPSPAIYNASSNWSHQSWQANGLSNPNSQLAPQFNQMHVPGNIAGYNTIPTHLSYPVEGQPYDDDAPHLTTDVAYTGKPSSSGTSYNEFMKSMAPDPNACMCGDGCSCFGCPVHPYNETTRNGVQELTEILEADMAADIAAQTLPTPNNELSGLFTGSSPISGSISPQDMNGGYQFGNEHQQFGQRTDLSMPGQMQIPDYSTFAFEFQHCYGQADTCLCDENCACPGCVTHQNAPFPGLGPFDNSTIGEYGISLSSEAGDMEIPLHHIYESGVASRDIQTAQASSSRSPPSGPQQVDVTTVSMS